MAASLDQVNYETDSLSSKLQQATDRLTFVEGCVESLKEANHKLHARMEELTCRADKHARDLRSSGPIGKTPLVMAICSLLALTLCIIVGF